MKQDLFIVAMASVATMGFLNFKITETMAVANSERINELTQQVESLTAANALLSSSDDFDQNVALAVENYIASERERLANEQADREAEAKAQRIATIVDNLTPVSPETDYIRGDANADFTLIEFSDYDCPFCQRFHDTGKRLVGMNDISLNWVYRHFPLPSHGESAVRKAEAAECAGELGGSDAFWSVTDALFAKSPNEIPLNTVPALVAEVTEIDMSAFQTCFLNREKEALVTADYDEGVLIGVSGTPTHIIINNNTGELDVVSGALPFGNFITALQQLDD